jgi:hypothetical protein
MHLACAAAVAVAIGASPALADEFGDAQDAAAAMAAIKICNIVVPEAAKRAFYGEILSVYHTPHNGCLGDQ